MVEVCRGKLVILDGTPGHTVYMYRHFNDKMECFFFSDQRTMPRECSYLIIYNATRRKKEEHTCVMSSLILETNKLPQLIRLSAYYSLCRRESESVFKTRHSWNSFVTDKPQQ